MTQLDKLVSDYGRDPRKVCQDLEEIDITDLLEIQHELCSIDELAELNELVCQRITHVLYSDTDSHDRANAYTKIV